MTSDTEYDSVEKEFQHNKIETHGLAHEADAMLSLLTPKDIMYRACNLVPKLSEQWEKQEMMVMEICCHHKFNNCSHTRTALLRARSEIVEATLDKKWGSELDIQRTQECHPDYWPGENKFGKILAKIWRDLESDWHSWVEQEVSHKHKPGSPIDEQNSKCLQ